MCILLMVNVKVRVGKLFLLHLIDQLKYDSANTQLSILTAPSKNSLDNVDKKNLPLKVNLPLFFLE